MIIWNAHEVGADVSSNVLKLRAGKAGIAFFRSDALTTVEGHYHSR